MGHEKEFIESFNELEIKTGISKDAILKALKEALDKGLKKQLGGDDALTEVNIDLEKGTLSLAHMKTVVETVEDDFLEISLDDAKKEYPDIKLGDLYRINIPFDSITKSNALTIRSVFKQKLNEAEKEALYEVYHDKIGEMITGTVDKVEENGLQVTIARTTLFVPRKELIGDELDRYEPKDTIKLYVSSVDKGTKGARINVSRSNEGYLKRVFEEEIHEIYDGTIIIKGIARKAGERSKVAVYSNDPNVDPAGACIGPNGNRIQKVVAQLGNGPTKEKVDVIGYSDNDGLFIMEALKPAQVIGVSVDKENRKAIAVVNDGNLSIALGRKWVNVKLAEQLCKYHIDIKEETQAKEEGIEYQTFEELERLDVEARQKAAQEAIDRMLKEQAATNAANTLTKNTYVAPDKRHYEDDITDEERETLEEVVDKEELNSTIVAQPSTSEEEKEVLVETTAKNIEETKIDEPQVEKTSVQTTTTLADLEKELELESQKAKTNVSKSKKKAKKEEQEEDSSIIRKVNPEQRMSIYTDEELKALEEEENDYDEDYDDDEDIDYNEYDEYYDDEGK